MLKNYIDGVHDGKKSHLCYLCGYRAVAERSLKLHIAVVHKKEKSYNCSICNCEFSDNSYLQRHIEQAHEEKNPIEKSIDLEDLVLPSHVQENDEVFGDIKVEKSAIGENIKENSAEIISETGGKDSEKLVVQEVGTLFQCPRCDSSFFWKQSLNKHILY